MNISYSDMNINSSLNRSEESLPILSTSLKIVAMQHQKLLLKIAAQNRKNLIQRFPGKLTLLFSNTQPLRNSDVHHPFRQDSYFTYMAGVEQPHHALLIDTKAKTTHLIIPDLNEHYQIWEGKQNTTTDSHKLYQIKSVYQSDLAQLLKKKLKTHKTLHILPHQKQAFKDLKIKCALETKALQTELDELRAIKSKLELQLMQKASTISSLAHEVAMQVCTPGTYENQLLGPMESIFLEHHAKHAAYLPIVAAGENAAILHYNDNNQKIKKSDLVLIDYGCEYHGYAADITRTFPASGKFSTKQKQIYQIVLDVQNACIKAVKPNASLIGIHKLACKLTVEGLMKLGFFKTNDVNELIKNNVHRVFFPHGIGHLLGLDVHDVNPPSLRQKGTKNLRSAITLKEGMVLTIEPGIYFIDFYFRNPAKAKAYNKWINWNKVKSYQAVGGIRIEDNIVVTKTGHKNLTKVAKSIQDIQNLMHQS